MLDIKRVQSVNKVMITGILNELSIEQKITADGREYVQGVAKIRVDQDINGKVVENEIPVRMFSMKKKKDGTDNMIYKNIVKMSEDFISLAAAETPSQASKVSIINGQIQENSYFDQSSGIVRTNFQLFSNFMRKANSDDESSAKFELSGVIGNISDEIDKNGEETGRLVIKFIIVGYMGEVDVVTLIAENPIAVNHIRNNWEKGDTVTLTGKINMSYKIVTWEEEQGFGEPIKRTKTESKRELIITGGCPCGLDEEMSYDSDSIKLALDDRTMRINAMKEKNVKPINKKTDFGF